MIPKILKISKLLGIFDNIMFNLEAPASLNSRRMDSIDFSMDLTNSHLDVIPAF